MKKAIMIALVAVCALGSVASAAYIQTSLPAGLDLVAVPQVPLNSDPFVVFSDIAGNPMGIDGNLIRWDAVNKGYVSYSIDFSADYGGTILGDGAWLNVASDTVWKYDAAPNGLKMAGETAMTDMWISLPTAGLTLFGNPFNSQVAWSSCMMTDGSKMVDIMGAVTEGWVDGTCVGWDNVNKGYTTVGFGDFDEPNLTPWAGYWIQTSVNNLALIVPAPAN